MTPIIRYLGMTLCLLCLAGCTFTKLETARQLDASETVYSGSLDFVGFGPIPRAQVNAMRGLGDRGDISAHIGTTLVSANAGLGGRLYLGDRFNLSLQTDAMTILIEHPWGPNRFERFLVTGTPRLTTAVQDGEFFYGGLQSHVFTGVQPGQAEFLGLTGGVLAGIDIARSFGGFQAELILYPISYFEGRVAFPTNFQDGDGVVVMQLSLGIYFR